MASRTIFLARLIGIVAVLIAAALYLHPQLVSLLIADAPLLLVMGMISLAAGVAIVPGHNIWTGGVLPVVVTLLGWLLLLRGVVLVALSPDATAAAFRAIQFEQHAYLYLLAPLVIGLYLI